MGACCSWDIWILNLLNLVSLCCVEFCWVYLGFGNGHAFILETYGFLVYYVLLVSVVKLLLGVHGFWEWACIYFWDVWILNLLCLLVNVVELLLDVHGFWE
jgi:hypothetical protein